MPAAGQLELRIAWQNRARFEMSSKRGGGGGWKTVVAADEDGRLSELWPHLRKICEVFLAEELTTIGKEMKG